MNTPPIHRILIAAAVGGAFPTALYAQSLFHAPMPPLPPAPPAQPQQTAQPVQQAPQPQQQPQPANPAATSPTAASDTPAPPAPAPPAPAAQSQTAVLPPQQPVYQPPTAAQVSLFAVKPTLPRKFNKQDKVEIIVNESSLQKFDQNFDGKESSDNSVAVTDFPDMAALFSDGVLVNNGKSTFKIGAGNKANYKGDGSYERKEKFTARISAIVTDVKPNGLLVLEARKTILSDSESQSIVVSGLCDPKDVTDKGTVQSTQLANLVIKKGKRRRREGCRDQGVVPTPL